MNALPLRAVMNALGRRMSTMPSAAISQAPEHAHFSLADAAGLLACATVVSLSLVTLDAKPRGLSERQFRR